MAKTAKPTVDDERDDPRRQGNCTNADRGAAKHPRRFPEPKEAAATQPEEAKAKEGPPRARTPKRDEARCRPGDGQAETTAVPSAVLSTGPSRVGSGGDDRADGAGSVTDRVGDAAEPAKPASAASGAERDGELGGGEDEDGGKSKSPFDASKPDMLQSDHFSSIESSSSSSNDDSNYPPSCIVKLPAGVSSGDRLTIRWPTRDQSKNGTTRNDGSGERGKRKGADEVVSNGTRPKRSRSGIGRGEAAPDLLVRITLPSRLEPGMRASRRHVRVFAPWVTADRAAANALTARQLRGIGVGRRDGRGAGPRRSRRGRTRNHGEGNFSVGHSRIGGRYQVSSGRIPPSGTWEKERSEGRGKAGGGAEAGGDDAAVVGDDRIWDGTLSEEARDRGGPVDRYMESLHSYQKARGVMTLHQSAYEVASAVRRFNKETASSTPFPDKPAPAGQRCEKPHAMLEGKPLSRREQSAFNEAIQEHRKQWPIIAKAVGTSVNRCLIHYYSNYKAGAGRGDYLKHKKIWEQSDECEVCKQGGDLLCCDGCVDAYHLECVDPPMKRIPVGQWFCPKCQSKKE